MRTLISTIANQADLPPAKVGQCQGAIEVWMDTDRRTVTVHNPATGRHTEYSRTEAMLLHGAIEAALVAMNG